MLTDIDNLLTRWYVITMSPAKFSTKAEGKPAKTKMVAARVSVRRHREIRVLCTRLGLSMQEFLERGLQLALAELKNGRK